MCACLHAGEQQPSIHIWFFLSLHLQSLSLWNNVTTNVWRRMAASILRLDCTNSMGVQCPPLSSWLAVSPVTHTAGVGNLISIKQENKHGRFFKLYAYNFYFQNIEYTLQWKQNTQSAPTLHLPHKPLQNKIGNLVQCDATPSAHLELKPYICKCITSDYLSQAISSPGVWRCSAHCTCLHVCLQVKAVLQT